MKIEHSSTTLLTTERYVYVFSDFRFINGSYKPTTRHTFKRNGQWPVCLGIDTSAIGF